MWAAGECKGGIFLFTVLEVSAKGMGLGEERNLFVSALIFKIIDAEFAC